MHPALLVLNVELLLSTYINIVLLPIFLFKPVILIFFMDSSLDEIGGNPDSGNEGCVQMRKIIQDFDLVDAFRYLHPKKIITTWRGPNVSTRIDRFYISSRFASRCLKNHNVWPCHFSDHDFIGINVILDNARSIGLGYWKFNNSILDDGSYNLEFRCFWQELIQNQNITHEWWEHAKLEIKKFTLAYCKRKSKLKNSRKRDHERRYTELVLAEYNNRRLFRSDKFYLKRVKCPCFG
ncbi:hypothetical protein SNE40_004311 [Patella caerulea]|uniref:Uncharacterized protein n=2 Tax=Patella caerulea TaxID=87958 RepID=A0AAN8K5G5_PATCE